MRTIVLSRGIVQVGLAQSQKTEILQVSLQNMKFSIWAREFEKKPLSLRIKEKKHSNANLIDR